jgi:hypothetical protein
VRLDHVARFIVNANHSMMRADEKVTAFVELESAIRVEQRLAASHGHPSVDLRLRAAIAKS